MIIKFTKQTNHDQTHAIRDDGTEVIFNFPKKGPFPHDAVHVFVEKRLNLKNGFWGMINQSYSPEKVGQLAKEGGHASASRAIKPSHEIVELIQAERTVECFEAEIWNPSGDPELFINVLKAACDASHIPMPEITASDIEEIRKLIEKYYSEWQSLSIGENITLDFVI